MPVHVDIVENDTVQPDGSHQPCIVLDSFQVPDDLSVLVKNRLSGIASFDAAVHIVPLVEHAETDARILQHVSILAESAAKDLPYKSENAIECAGSGFCRDNGKIGIT